jgi:hypothetical protein
MQGAHEIGGKHEAAVQDRYDEQRLDLPCSDVLGQLGNATRDVLGLRRRTSMLSALEAASAM